MKGRPAAFDAVPLREAQTDRGAKEFENRVRRGLEHLGGWTARFSDIVNVDKKGNIRGTAAVSPPDYIHCNRGFNLLVECKTFICEPGKRTATTAFDRLEPHQREDLLAFSDVGPAHHGCIAILFYNRERGNARVYRCFLLPIEEWVGLEMTLDQKSIPWHVFDDDLAQLEAHWVGGNKSYFDLKNPMIQITNRSIR